ncbi:hydrogenase expression/formation C-terminal domain-containing protein [Sporolituus thermophilus]|uniref:Hydrogenase-1 operon protein HyaF n=1 Tax=Sporolituus thermophilus DSM 23256 TaxID=1123285 RepID=A0A1G7JJ87_9FIRM|nr:hydrogenase expression/formation C-terminal domain-containing protein [Sporolituus thermophilus]SDF25007.1 hydrogenase-1 operon protein HyaF [Sporolituus thermophilus DSM 23256]
MMQQSSVSAHARAVLAEIAAALERFASTGETYTLFVNKMGLTQADREAIHAFLGQGTAKVLLNDTAEPAEWLETGIAGVWYGVFYDANRRPAVETIEISDFPRIAAAQPEDIAVKSAELRQRLTEL